MKNILLPHTYNIGYIFQTVSKYAKCKNLIIIKLFVYHTLTAGVFLIGCVNTEGTLKIKGTVIDEGTKMQIPGRAVIVQGLIERNDRLVPIDAGQFSTDSSGCFSYSLKKLKDAYFYNFCIVGDSDYAFNTRKVGLLELEQNAEYLSFPLSKLVDVTIRIYRKSKTPVCDTLYLSWESDGVDGRNLYPYKIDNFGNTSYYFTLTSYLEIRWIGGNVNSTIKAKVFADKRTKINWELDRNRKREEFIDTITCKRDLVNIVNFTY